MGNLSTRCLKKPNGLEVPWGIRYNGGYPYVPYNSLKTHNRILVYNYLHGTHCLASVVALGVICLCVALLLIKIGVRL